MIYSNSQQTVLSSIQQNDNTKLLNEVDSTNDLRGLNFALRPFA